MSGFLVEIRPGRELLYRTTWALREAMRSGEITPDSRIFHRATSQWVSITEHPEYRRFLTDHDHPEWFQPQAPDVQHEAPANGNGRGRRLNRIITRLAGGLAGLKRRLESAAPTREEAAPEQPEELKPVLRPVSEIPSAPPPPPEPPKPSPPSPSSTRDRWTFFP